MKSANIVKRWCVVSCMIPMLAFAVSGCGTLAANNATNTTAAKTTATANTVSTSSKRHVTAIKTPIATMHVPYGNINVPILELHNSAYVPNWPYAAAPGQFAAEMKWLHEHDFHSITLNQLWDAAKYGKQLPSRPIVISFDDGHESNWTMATPILKKYGYVATEFDVTGAIGKKGYLSVEELRDMEKSGVWEVECHTVHHPHLSKLSTARITYEVTASKKRLQSILGQPVYYFCYPYGDYDGRVIEALHKAGYRFATTVHQGYANPSRQGTLTLDRIACHEDLTLQEFAQRLSPSLRQPVSNSGRSV